METTYHLTRDELEAGLDYIRQSPKTEGVVMMIVRRPAVDARETLMAGELTIETGLAGDTWDQRPSKAMPDHAPNPQAQVTLMNARAVALIAQTEDRWPLAGDQFYVDLDLSVENLPAGTQLRLGSAIVEISAQPHTGCAKFSQRYGVEAHKFVNSKEGSPLRLRGVNARVVQAGTVRVGDVMSRL
jgi:MOSC domain-containing protein YiiM